MRTEQLFHWKWTREYRWVTINWKICPKIFFCVSSFSSQGWGNFYDLYRPLSNFLMVFKKNIWLYTWNENYNQIASLFLFSLWLNKPENFYIKILCFYLPSLKPMSCIGLFQVITLCKEKTTVFEHESESKARLPSTFSERLTLYSLNPKFSLCSFLFGVIF